ncbi:hypothetical protein [Rubrivirga sp.]|uniref:hypothetical protein n=1 Tax=Rubrivirga sp. TaxID=1885344 RepID=UPI003C752803
MTSLDEDDRPSEGGLQAEPAKSRIQDLPAFDRVQSRETAETSTLSSWLKSAGFVALVLAGVGLVLWLFTPEDQETSDLLERLVATAENLQPDLVTTVPDDARELVLNELGWSVPPPEFTAIALVAASICDIGEIKPGEAMPAVPVQIPAFRYEGADDARAHVFAYDYILLDRVGRVFDLPDAVYAVLSEPSPVDSRVVNGHYVVTWRKRSMIFSAITPDEAIAELIRQTVAT